jgi:DNA-binding IclR family transcriptional regulator
MLSHKTPSVPAVDKALSLLETLAPSRRGLGLAQLAKQLRLPRSSAHCLLLTLERRGYLQRNEMSHRYLFGLKLYSLANTALAQLKVRELAAPHLQSLAKAAHLVVHMAILEKGEAVIIEKSETPGLLRLATWVGKRLDVHCSGTGKALIAWLPKPELDQLLSGHSLPCYNENTIVSRRKLEANLQQARNLGYTLDDEEGELGFRCIGCPVFDRTGRNVAAISVAGPTSEITAERIPSLAGQVMHTAIAISQLLGFSERTPRVGRVPE